MFKLPNRFLQVIQNNMEQENNKKEEANIWYVTLTYYTDDYKPRGDDWSRTDGPHFFRTQANAEKYFYV